MSLVGKAKGVDADLRRHDEAWMPICVGMTDGADRGVSYRVGRYYRNGSCAVSRNPAIVMKLIAAAAMT
jgi:hypothetical protein